MELSKMNNEEQKVLNIVDTGAFIDKIINKVKALAMEKRLQVEIETQISVVELSLRLF